MSCKDHFYQNGISIIFVWYCYSAWRQQLTAKNVWCGHSWLQFVWRKFHWIFVLLLMSSSYPFWFRANLDRKFEVVLYNIFEYIYVYICELHIEVLLIENAWIITSAKVVLFFITEKSGGIICCWTLALGIVCVCCVWLRYVSFPFSIIYHAKNLDIVTVNSSYTIVCCL